MDPIEIPPLDFALVAELCISKGLVLAQSSNTTIAITRDSMVKLFPRVENEGYYASTVELLREITPAIHWMPMGKTDDVGYFVAYPKTGWNP